MTNPNILSFLQSLGTVVDESPEVAAPQAQSVVEEATTRVHRLVRCVWQNVRIYGCSPAEVASWLRMPSPKVEQYLARFDGVLLDLGHDPAAVAAEELRAIGADNAEIMRGLVTR